MGGGSGQTAVDESDGSDDASYSGSTSVIPSYAPDGGTDSLVEAYATGPSDPDADSSVAPCPRDAGAVDAETTVDAPIEAASSDGGCPGGLAAGDLVIDELMIASQPGVGDHGEWIEVRSTQSCTLSLNGLFAEVPHGKGSTIASITTDVWLPAHGFFLIADSALALDNHDLPAGMLVTWGLGNSSDVLKNSGDTITLYTASVVIDALTYPASAKLVDGASMAFPSDCDPSLRVEFGNWQPSLSSFSPGFFGTPFAPNTDVHCGVVPLPPPAVLNPSPCGGQ